MPTVKVRATGKAAHAGNHHRDGANAIWALCVLVDRLAARDDVRWLTVEGGTSRNTVPDMAELTFSCSQATLDALDLSTDVPGTSLALEVE